MSLFDRPVIASIALVFGGVMLNQISGCAIDNYKEGKKEKAEAAQRKIDAIILEAKKNTRNPDSQREGHINPHEDRILVPAKLLEEMNPEQRVKTLSWARQTKQQSNLYLGHVIFGTTKENITGRRIILNEPSNLLAANFLDNVTENGLGIIFNSTSYGDSAIPTVDYFISSTTDASGNAGITVKEDTHADGKDVKIILEHTPN